MDSKMQMEWLVDCYRLRLNAEKVSLGQIRPGSLYDQSGAAEIVQDFLIFCHLAKQKNTVPDDWIWSQFLLVAAENLAKSFNQKDAKEKYTEWSRLW